MAATELNFFQVIFRHVLGLVLIANAAPLKAIPLCSHSQVIRRNAFFRFTLLFTLIVKLTKDPLPLPFAEAMGLYRQTRFFLY